MATLQSIELTEQTRGGPSEIEVPSPTAWPLVLGLGFTLMCAGLLTSISVSILGIVLAVAGCIGWFREVLPRPHEIALPVVPDELVIATQRRVVDRLPAAQDQLRAWLPLHTHPISAGLRGGWAGGAAMAVIACAYGLIKAGSIWYPVNLLAASVYAQSVKLISADLSAFHADSFAIALGLHFLVSTAVGLLYGAMLPMFARRPILLGGLIGPVLWSALVYAMLSLLNPLLESHIDWLWFMASQAAFGIVAGLVVERGPRVPTRENISFLVRAGVEAPGMIPPRETGGERP
jgi:hypothetical protein